MKFIQYIQEIVNTISSPSLRTTGIRRLMETVSVFDQFFPGYILFGRISRVGEAVIDGIRRFFHSDQGTVTFQMKSGDTLPNLELEALSSSGWKANLSDAKKVNFHMTNAETGDVIVNRKAYIRSFGNALLTHDWDSGDTDVPGWYFGEFEVEWKDGDITSYPTTGHINIRIEEEIN